MALVNRGLFAVYGHEDILKKKKKKLLLQNRWSDFEVISQKCSLSDLSQKVFAKF